MRVKMLDGAEYDLSQAVLDELKLRLKGPVLVDGNAGFEESRTVWNAMIDRKPAFVVRCLGTADVLACVRFAREHNLLMCIKGGGHNIAGLAVADGAMMLDMSLMRGVWTDDKEKIVRVQAGGLLGDVDRDTQLHGLATPLGFVSLTGVAGLTLGGGFGYLSRRYGWTVDNVVGMDIVTAEGELVHASRDENADLFWALRGGGGNFGVITGFNYKLYPVGPVVVGGFVAWPASEATEVVELFKEQAEKVPNELSLVMIIRPAPAVPWLPKDRHGTPIVLVGACYSGRLEDGDKIVAPIKSFGKPIGDILVRRPYIQLQSLLDAGNPKGRRCYWKSEYLPQIEPAFSKKFINHAAKIQSPYSSAVLFQLGGAINQVDDEHLPVGNRDARYVFTLTSAWEKTEADTANIEWTRQAWTDMKQFSTGGTYLNFLTEDDGLERTKAALGKGFDLLAKVKAKWDPENVFRTNRNIKPA